MLLKRKNAELIQIMRQIHPLTLDQKWHELFGAHKTNKMSELEKKLNELLRNQGQATNDYKEYSQLKRQLLTDILGEMPQAFDAAKEASITHMSKNKKYIADINQKLKKLENRLIKLPKEIEATNSELLDFSMAHCYERIIQHKKAFEGIDPKINSLREELKTLMVKKSENKEQYDLLYTYMHDLVGPEIIEQYDKMYLGGKFHD